MCNTIKKNYYELGFSLLELAIVMVMAGLIIAPATSMYHNYRVEKDWSETEDNKGMIVKEVGSFRTLFGRYPCPSSITAAPGDIEYGLEDVNCSAAVAVYPAAGACANGICAYSNGLDAMGNDKLVLVGAFPYKIMDLFEGEAYDSKNTRFTYAVSADLTSSVSFDMTGGDVGIVDKVGNSVIQPVNSAHFVVVSHGANQIGGYTKFGVLVSACGNGSVDEQENCDADGVFLSGEIDNDFDDRIAFFSSAPYSEWQKSAADQNIIHLKNSNGIAVGASTATDLSAAEETTVRAIAVDTGSIQAEGSFFIEALCDENAINQATDCFAPRLIAGDLTPDGTHFNRLEAETVPGSGMSCYTPSTGDDTYLVGIENGQPMCEDEIYVSCPDGSFIKGIDASGVVKCDTAPQPRCFQANVNTTCNGRVSTTTTRSIGNLGPGTASGDVEFAYSGECRKITDRNWSYFNAQSSGFSSYADVQAHINTLNTEVRAIEECGALSNNSQVRDAYVCNSGTWNHASAQEKLYPWSSFPGNINAGAPWPAETSYNGTDVNNSSYYHDCWCREDYRVRAARCGDGTWRGYRIEKHRCPQTSHYWHHVYTNYSLCTCTPVDRPSGQSCNSYYNEVAPTTGTNGLGGTAYKNYHYTCPGGPSGALVKDALPYNSDTTGCYCPARAPGVQRTYCPVGTTNSWVSSYGTETGVSGLSTNTWTCPGGSITDSFGHTIPNPGSWSGIVPFGGAIPACVCDTNLTKFEYKNCPSNLSGPLNAIKYKVEWICGSGWEPEEDWEEISNACKGCKWEASGAGSASSGVFITEVGDDCACGDLPVLTCTERNASGVPTDPHLTHAPCQCIVQP